MTGSTRPGTAAPSSLNDRLAAADLPVRVSNLSSIWMVHYTEPSRYNWMLQYYLRAEGLALSWVGTGRLIFSLNYTDADFAEVADRFVAAAEKMKRDGWWWQKPAHQQDHPPADPERDACRTVRGAAVGYVLPSPTACSISTSPLCCTVIPGWSEGPDPESRAFRVRVFDVRRNDQASDVACPAQGRA